MTDDDTSQTRQRIVAVFLVVIMALSVFALGGGTAAAFEPTFELDSTSSSIAANPATDGDTTGINHTVVIALNPSNADDRTTFDSGDTINISETNGDIDYSGVDPTGSNNQVEFIKDDGSVQGSSVGFDSSSLSVSTSSDSINITSRGLSEQIGDDVEFIRVVLAHGGNNIVHNNADGATIKYDVEISSNDATRADSVTTTLQAGDNAPIQLDAGTETAFSSFDRAINDGVTSSTTEVNITTGVSEFNNRPDNLSSGFATTTFPSENDVTIQSEGDRETIEFTETGSNNIALDLGSQEVNVSNIEFVSVESAQGTDFYDTAIQTHPGQDNVDIDNNRFQDFKSADTDAVVTTGTNTPSANSFNITNNEFAAPNVANYAGVFVDDTNTEVRINGNTLDNVGSAGPAIEIDDISNENAVTLNNNDINSQTGGNTGIDVAADGTPSTNANISLDGNSIGTTGDGAVAVDINVGNMDSETVDIDNTDVAGASSEDIDGIVVTGGGVDGGGVTVDIGGPGDTTSLTDVDRGVLVDLGGASSTVPSHTVNVDNVSVTVQNEDNGTAIDAGNIASGANAGPNVTLAVDEVDISGDSNADGIVVDDSGNNENISISLDDGAGTTASSFSNLGTAVDLQSLDDLNQNTINHTTFTSVDNGINIQSDLGSTSQLTLDNLSVGLQASGGTGINFNTGDGTNLVLDSVDVNGDAASPASTGIRVNDPATVLNTKPLGDNGATIAGVNRGLNINNIDRHDTTTIENLVFEDIGSNQALVVSSIDEVGSDPNQELTLANITVRGDSSGATGIDVSETDLNNVFVENATLGTTAGSGVSTGISLPSGGETTNLHVDAATGSTEINLASGGANGIVYSDDGLLQIDGQLDINGLDSNAPATNGILVDNTGAIDFVSGTESSTTVSTVNDGIEISDGNFQQGTLTGLTFDEIGNGAALGLNSSYTGSLTLDQLSVDDGGAGNGAAVIFDGTTSGNNLEVNNSDLGTSTRLGAGVIAGTVNNVVVDNTTVALSDGGSQGVFVDDTGAGDVTIRDAVTIDGPDPSSAQDHAAAGIRINADTDNTVLTLADTSQLDVSGVNRGLQIDAADLLDDGSTQNNPTIDSASFTEIGDQGGIIIADDGLTDSSPNRITFDSITVTFQNDQSVGDADGTGIDLTSTGGSSDEHELVNLDIQGDTDASGDIAVDVDTGNKVAFDGDGASSASSISGVNTGLQIQTADGLNDDTDFASVSTAGNVTGTTFTDIGSGQAIQVQSSATLGSNNDVVFDQIDVDTSPSATAIDFDDSGTNLEVKESEFGSSTSGDTVDLGVDVQGVNTLTLTNSNNEINLANSGTAGVRVNAGSSGSIDVEDITIAGASSQSDRANFGINIVNTGGTVSIDNPTDAQSDISGVDVAINAQSGTNDLSDITNTTFSGIGDGSGSDDAAVAVTDVDLGDTTLTLDNIQVDSSPTATAVAVALSGDVNNDSLVVTNSDLGATTGNVKQGVVFTPEGNSSSLDVTSTDIGLADSDGTGIDFSDTATAGDLTLDTVTISGSGSTGVDVNGEPGNTTITGLDSTLQVDDVSTGVSIRSAAGLNNDEVRGVGFTNIGSDAALKITADGLASGSTVDISELDVGLADDSGTGINISTGGNTDYNLSNNVVSGTSSSSGTGVSIDASSGQAISFDEGVSDGSASEISNVDTGVRFTDGDLNDPGSGVIINLTEFDNIGSTAIDVDEPNEVSGSQLTVRDVIVDDSSSATAVEFDTTDTGDTYQVQNLSVNSGSVQEGVNVETGGQLNVTDSSIIVTDDSAAAGIIVDDGDTSVGIERNTIDSAASSDGSGTGVQLDAISSGHLIFLNNIEGFNATDGFGLAGDDVDTLNEETAIANFWGSDLGPRAANGSSVELSGTDASQVRIYDPHLTVDTGTLVDNIDNSNARTLDEVTVNFITDYAHSMIIESGDHMVFPGDSARTLNESYSVAGGSQDTGQQAFEYNATTNSYDPITDGDVQPNAFDDVAFEFQDSSLSATLAVEYDTAAGSTVREVEYSSGVNLVAATSNATLDSNLNVSDGTSVTESDQTFGLNDSELDLSNVTIATIRSPSGAPYEQDFQDPPIDAELYNESNDVNGEISPFAPTFVIIEQDDEDFDNVATRTLTPLTMDEVVERGDSDNQNEFDDES